MRTRRFFFYFFLWAVLSSLAMTPTTRAAVASDFAFATLSKSGAEPNDLPYRYLVPTGYNASNSYPIIVFLHGSGERGNDNTAQLNNNANGALQLVSTANQATYPCFMLAPQASIAEGWNGNTLAQVVRAIQQLKQMYSIDLNRVYVTGLSMGGGGTWQIITSYPFFFAAAVPMSGWGAGSYERIVGEPIWAFHSADDGTVGVSGSDNAVSAVRQLGGRAIYTRYATGGHGIWPTAYANPYLLPWIMAQHRNRPAAGTPIVSISSPTPPIVPPPIVSVRNVSGTATIPGTIAQVNWTVTPWTGGAGIDSSTYGVATGTAAWSISNAAMAGNSTLFLVVATGPSWATGTGSSTGGGVTTLNDFFWNVPTGANLSAPTIALTTPTNSTSYTTAANTLNFTGTAAGTGSKSIKAITWRNDRGGEGIGLGTTAWNIDNVDLQPGDNLLTITVRDSASVSASTTLLVHASGAAPPVFTAQPVSQTATLGSAVTFTATATGSPAPSYQWRKNNVNLSGATSNSYSVATVSATDAGSYTVVASNASGSVTSTSATLTLTANAASYTGITFPASAVIGSTISFTCVVTNTGTQAWGANHYLALRDVNSNNLAFASLNGVAVSGNKTATLSFVVPAVAGTYTYYVQGVEAGVEFFSTRAALTLNVSATPPKNAMSFGATTFPASVAAGAAVSFTYAVTNTGSQPWGANHYLALRDASLTNLAFASLSGVATSGSKTASLSFNAPSIPGTYTYYVQGVEAGVEFFSTKSTLTLTVFAAPPKNAMSYDTTTFPAKVTAGTVVGFSYHVTNTGTQAWGSNHYLSLRNSNGTYLDFALTSGVAVGGSVTLKLSFTAPSIPGNYTYFVQGVENGVEFFSTQSVLTLLVPSAPLLNAVQYNTTTFPATATAGATVNFTYNVTNSGAQAWGPNHYLSVRNSAGVFQSFALMNGVAIGSSTTASLSLVAPSSPGTYIYYVDAVENGVEFFSTQATLILVVP